MSVPHRDRPLDKVREEVIDQLIINYSHGELSAEAFERRLDQAYETNDQEALVALTADLPLQTDPRYHSEKEARMRPTFSPSSEAKEFHQIDNILGSESLSGEWVVPKQIEVKCILGSVDLDFTHAVFSSPEVTITFNGWLSSLDIIVPRGIDVSTNMKSIMGSVENSRKRLGNVGKDIQRPRIHIVGQNILSSVDISEKTDFKEQVLAFADSLKSLFDDKPKRSSKY